MKIKDPLVSTFKITLPIFPFQYSDLLKFTKQTLARDGMQRRFFRLMSGDSKTLSDLPRFVIGKSLILTCPGTFFDGIINRLDRREN